MYHIGFSLRLSFSAPVERHYYTLRLLPLSPLLGGSLVVNGQEMEESGRDAFLNRLVAGRIAAPHDCFLASLECNVEASPAEIVESRCEDDIPYFRHPTRLTSCTEELASLASSLGGSDPFEVALSAMEMVSDSMHYIKGSTGNETSAGQAYAARCGVCQDYAHIMLALLRERGITSRYVAGVSLGEGESHAWVEVLYKGRWRAYDPTRRQQAGPSYFPFAYGRDALDSPLNSGVYYGIATSRMDVLVSCREC